jgi:hypothetical protein
MQRTVSPDRLTAIAIAAIAYAGLYICHEIVGHCGMASLVGNRCSLLSSINIPLVNKNIDFHSRQYHLILIAGSTANWTVGLICLALLRTRRAASPAWRYFLWLSMCVNLFLPSTYLLAAPIIKFGDAYLLIDNLPGQLFWRSVPALAGAAACWFSFRLCRKELSRLIGFGGPAARRVAWELVAPAYVAGGLVVVTSASLSALDFKIAQLEAAGGTFGLTAWLLLLPFSIPEAPESAEHPFTFPRSIRWIVAGAVITLTFIGVLGPGIPL